MATPPPLFSAVTTSSRQLLLLLRCISFAKKAQVRISPDGIRFSTEEGSAMEAFIFLDKALFSTYTYTTPPPPSSQDDPPAPPIFEINLASLLETLNIFTLSDPAATSRKAPTDYESFRLHRHAGINAFSNHALGLSGICRLSYAGPGAPLSIHMSEAGVTTTCDLTTYEPRSMAAGEEEEEIPFRRDAIALKTIMRASYLLDTVAELSAMNPAYLTILASPPPAAASTARGRGSTAQPNLSLTASGALGSASVDFHSPSPSPASFSSNHALDTDDTTTPVLETFHCPRKTSASFKFALVKAAQRAMASAAKVSLRLDEEGVLSLQFLVEVESAGAAGSAGAGGEAVAFVDFRVVPLVEGESGGDGDGEESTDDE